MPLDMAVKNKQWQFRLIWSTGETFRSTSASYYLVAEGRYGHRSVFAWEGLDPSITDKAVYVATKRNGTPLSDTDGPFELVVLGQDTRCVKQLSTLRVEPKCNGLRF
jgi:hypothetical protein